MRIVVSGDPCAGSTSLGRALAAQLGLTFYSVGEAARRGFVPPSDVALVTSYGDSGVLTSHALQRRLDAEQLARVRCGDIVIDSKLGLILLLQEYDVGVWVEASKETRIRRLAARLQCPHEEAAAHMAEREERETAVWFAMYGSERVDSRRTLASIRIDTTNSNVNACMEQVLPAIGRLR